VKRLLLLVALACAAAGCASTAERDPRDQFFACGVFWEEDGA